MVQKWPSDKPIIVVKMPRELYCTYIIQVHVKGIKSLNFLVLYVATFDMVAYKHIF